MWNVSAIIIALIVRFIGIVHCSPKVRPASIIAPDYWLVRFI
jgi:hypothetical protein